MYACLFEILSKLLHPFVFTISVLFVYFTYMVHNFFNILDSFDMQDLPYGS